MSVETQTIATPQKVSQAPQQAQTSSTSIPNNKQSLAQFLLNSQSPREDRLRVRDIKELSTKLKQIRQSMRKTKPKKDRTEEQVTKDKEKMAALRIKKNQKRKFANI